jgi:hypothetical protein
VRSLRGIPAPSMRSPTTTRERSSWGRHNASILTVTCAPGLGILESKAGAANRATRRQTAPAPLGGLDNQHRKVSEPAAQPTTLPSRTVASSRSRAKPQSRQTGQHSGACHPSVSPMSQCGWPKEASSSKWIPDPVSARSSHHVTLASQVLIVRPLGTFVNTGTPGRGLAWAGAAVVVRNMSRRWGEDDALEFLCSFLLPLRVIHQNARRFRAEMSSAQMSARKEAP